MALSPDVPTRRAGGRHGRPWRAAGVTLVALLALSGTALLTAGLNPAPAQPPQPAETGTAETGAGEASTPPAPGPGTAAPTPTAPPGTRSGAPGTASGPLAGASLPPPAAELPRSEPVRITIPKIKVNAKIIPLGVEDDGTVQVPSLKEAHLAGWYKGGASPGEIGNAVVVGHVDSAVIGPAVFFRLGSLKRGDRIEVTRKDGRVARFAVDVVTSFPKTAFPSELVYGDAETARLQVVTCGGTFDRKKGSYPNNIVVSATRLP